MSVFRIPGLTLLRSENLAKSDKMPDPAPKKPGCNNK